MRKEQVQVGDAVIVARPPEHCDFSGTWKVVRMYPKFAALNQRTSWINVDYDRMEPLTTTDPRGDHRG